MNDEQITRAKRTKERAFVNGSGCLVMLLGWAIAALLAFVVLPIPVTGKEGSITYGQILGLIVLIAFIVQGRKMGTKWKCGKCGNPIADKSVKICPTCKAHLE